MTPPLPRDAVLLVVDVQKGMDVYAAQYNRNNPDLEKNIARLQAAWRKSGRPIIHVQHLSTEPKSPLRPGQPGVDIKEEVRPLAGEGPHFLFDVDARLSRSERGLGLRGEVLDVDDGPPALAPGGLKPRDVLLEIRIVPIVLRRVDIHPFLDVDHQENRIAGKGRSHMLASGSGSTGGRADGLMGRGVSADPPIRPSAGRSFSEN